VAPLSIDESGQEEREKIVVQVDRIFAYISSAKQSTISCERSYLVQVDRIFAYISNGNGKQNNNIL
jgi:hypothetical protein